MSSSPGDPNQTNIDIRNVTLRSEGRHLDGVTLSVGPGESVAVLAQDQRLASLLLRACNGLEQPESGSIRIGATEVTTATRRELQLMHRDRVGWVPANAATFSNMSLLENVSLPLRYHGDEEDEASIEHRARALLREVGLEEEAMLRAAATAPEHRKRAAYARAVARNPAVLLVEDPSALLDPEGRAVVVQLHRRLERQGTTVLLADDDLEFASVVAGRAVVLQDGTIRYDGSFADLPDDVVSLFPVAQDG